MLNVSSEVLVTGAELMLQTPADLTAPTVYNMIVHCHHRDKCKHELYIHIAD